MNDFQVYFWLTMAALVFVVLPIALVWSLVDAKRRKPGQRRGGGGGVSSVVGGAMLEIDRITRPSVEHRVDTEQRVLKREDDTGGE